MDDEADDDQRGVEPDFCFAVDRDDSFYGNGDEEGVQIMTGATAGTFCTEASPGTDESVAYESTVSSRSSSRGEFHEILATPLVNEGLEDCARTPRPAPPSATSTTRRVGLGGLSKPRKAAVNTIAGNAPLPIQQPSTQDLAAGRRDAVDADKYPKLHNYSNRLGGPDITTFRDTVGAKHAH
ncbi:hypothetical protein PHYPSEUDO_008353 [Phytophthora pseudosyringae]|uniref:Uncharacterized protein n=1 Tax=Phytophthora pseudosyringae TaxID=221518 RepID=A0A8T1VEB9_9STRA|nr:hypothetical protein PHYPSEUDO_008353 [Phytophthora pseudosyringae]